MNINRLLKVLLSPVTILFVVAIFLLLYCYIDLYLTNIFARWNLRDNSLILNWVTDLGDGLIIVIFIFSALWFRYIKQHALWEARSWFIMQCILLSGSICFVLKIIFGRGRPKMWFNAHEYGFYWFNIKGAYWSFPSGHATTILSIAFAFSILFPRYWLMFLLLGFFIALSRILLGYHYTSDVFVAGYLTLLEVIFLVYFLRRKKCLLKIWEKDRQLYPVI